MNLEGINMWQREKIREMTITGLFTVLAIIGGKVSIPVLMIPFTLQTAVCFLTGMVLGRRQAMRVYALYLFMGLMGLPVFAKGGGPSYVFQPSFGYLPGLLFAAGLIGFLAEKVDPDRCSMKRAQAFLIHLCGLVVIYLFGVGYLYLLKKWSSPDSITFLRALQAGMLPYLFTDGIYAGVLAFVVPGLRRVTRPSFAHCQ